MAEKKKREKLERVTTEQGVARFPHLTKPDEYKGVTKYKAGLIVPSDAAIVELLTDRADSAFEKFSSELRDKIESGELKGKKLVDARKSLEEIKVSYPYESEYTDEGEETGNIIIKAASYATYKDSEGNEKPRKLPFFDSFGRRVEGSVPDIWGGSILCLSYDIFPYHMSATGLAGVSLRIAGVQIVELKTGGGATAADMGFGAVEGGYAASGLVNENEAEGDNGVDDDEF